MSGKWKIKVLNTPLNLKGIDNVSTLDREIMLNENWIP